MSFPPNAQRHDDLDEVWAVAEQIGLASLVSAVPGRAPSSTLVPVIRRDGRVYSHLAAGNPHASSLSESEPCLLQFLGPHAYISPASYVEPDVPTWNFVQIAVTATLRLVDRTEARWIVEQTVEEFEGRRATPASLELMQGIIEDTIDGVRAFEVLPLDVVGRFKLSRNRTAEDRARVVAQLREDGAAHGDLVGFMERAFAADPAA